MTGECGSCGRGGEELGAVRRVYVRAETWDEVAEAVAEERITVVDDVEQWCLTCRLQYPHQPVED